MIIDVRDDDSDIRCYRFDKSDDVVYLDKDRQYIVIEAVRRAKEDGKE